MEEQSDLPQLLRRTALKDEDAFAQLYEMTSPKLYSLCLCLLPSRAMAEEALQDAFVQIWHKAGDYHHQRGSVMAWMTSITRYRAIDILRATKPSQPFFERDYKSDQTEPSDFALEWERNSRLQGCLQELHEQQRLSIVLAFLEGLSHQQVTERIKEPLGSVKSWIRRGLQSLKRCLTHELS